VLVAIPLWLTFHMTPEGEGWSGEHAKVGYQMILEVALRPVLMVFGALFAFFLMTPIVWLANQMFFEYATSVNSTILSPITFFWVALGEAALYCVMLFYLISFVFSMVDKLPSQVMRWISISGNHTDQGLDHKVEQGFLAFRNEARGLNMAAKGGKEGAAGKGDRPSISGGKGGGAGAGDEVGTPKA
jgi:hypothetical protein